MNEMKPYEDLANAIILQAINDYAYADIKEEDAKKAEAVKNECVRFFKGKWITLLTNVDPDYLLRVAEEKRQKVNKRNMS